MEKQLLCMAIQWIRDRRAPRAYKPPRANGTPPMSDRPIGNSPTSMSEVELDLTAEEEWAEPSDAEHSTMPRRTRNRRFFFEDGNLYIIVGFNPTPL